VYIYKDYFQEKDACVTGTKALNWSYTKASSPNRSLQNQIIVTQTQLLYRFRRARIEYRVIVRENGVKLYIKLRFSGKDACV
jgi:hypothetical protein